MLGSWWRGAGSSSDFGRISVVVPLYNHAGYIADAIASILAQGKVVKEIVVVDDGSTDASASVMERLAGQDRRIRFERQDNQGAHATINTALGLCSGELLTILNSDDVYMPDRLATLAAALDADPGAGIAASGLQFMDGTGGAIDNAWHAQAVDFHRAGAGMGEALLNANFLMTTSNLVFRRSALEAVGAFAALRYAHDLDWLLRALALGQRIIVVDRPLMRYRIHASNTISEDHSGVRAEWAVAAAAYLTVLWDRPGAPPIDWQAASAVQTVLRKHELERAAALCMAYLRRHGATALDHSPLLTDRSFMDLIKGWV